MSSLPRAAALPSISRGNEKSQAAVSLRDTRRALIAGVIFPCLLSSRFSSARDADLIERLETKTFSKPLVASRAPEVQRYPAWLEGEWDTTIDFAGYEFPSRRILSSDLVKIATVPGFQKMSLAFVPDVGRDRTKYRMRFTHDERDGSVVEDRSFNLSQILTNYLMDENAVETILYNAKSDPNRTTIRFRKGATNNAERIELFTNARESATRDSDKTFFASEEIRQVTLGYSSSFSVARSANFDYQHVWTFTPQDKEDGVVNHVKVSLATVGFLQPQEALRFSSGAAPGSNGAPVPRITAATRLAFEPVVLYSHVLSLDRVQ